MTSKLARLKIAVAYQKALADLHARSVEKRKDAVKPTKRKAKKQSRP